MGLGSAACSASGTGTHHSSWSGKARRLPIQVALADRLLRQLRRLTDRGRAEDSPSASYPRPLAPVREHEHVVAHELRALLEEVIG